MNNASDLNWHQSKVLEESDDLPHISHSRIEYMYKCMHYKDTFSSSS